MESLLTFNVPLPFGNVTVATAFLILVYLVLTGLLQLGIELVSFTLGMDDKDSLIKKPKNILFKVFDKLEKTTFSKVIQDGKYYHVKTFYGSYLDKDDNYFWSSLCYRHHSQFKSEEEAYKRLNNYNKEKGSYFPSFLYLLLLVLTLDLFFFLLGIAFIPTISVAIILTTVFSVRMLSKKVWKNVAKGKQRLDGHDKDISEIKEKMGEK